MGLWRMALGEAAAWRLSRTAPPWLAREVGGSAAARRFMGLTGISDAAMQLGVSMGFASDPDAAPGPEALGWYWRCKDLGRDPLGFSPLLAACLCGSVPWAAECAKRGFSPEDPAGEKDAALSERLGLSKQARFPGGRALVERGIGVGELAREWARSRGGAAFAKVESALAAAEEVRLAGASARGAVGRRPSV